MWANIPPVPLNALGADELKRRIEAARILRGLEQTELDGLFDADGLGKSASRMERGKLPLTRARLDGLIRHLRVPEGWFTEPDVDRLVYPEAGASPLPDRLSAIEDQLRAAQLETEARAMAILRLLDERLPPSEAAPSRRRA
jgi:hypothetical protein